MTDKNTIDFKTKDGILVSISVTEDSEIHIETKDTDNLIRYYSIENGSIVLIAKAIIEENKNA